MSRVLFTVALTLNLTFSSALVAEGKVLYPTKADQKLLDEVAKQLLAKLAPHPDYQWPPTFRVIPGDEVNAYAYAQKNKLFPDLKPRPFVEVTAPMMRKVIKGDEDALALVVGHELGHICLKHVITKKQGDTKFAAIHFGQKKELDCDSFGADLMLKAGYSLRKGIRGERRIKNFTIRHAPLEKITSTHPAWDDRFAKISKEPKYWRAMNAFQNGVAFLSAEQFAAAVLCFERVTKDFPAAYEAWVNLGYARLMLYCDKLSQNDVITMEVGHVVCGGFYRRIKSLRPTNNRADKDLWFAAEAALLEANRLKPNLALVKANLGLAKLLHYESKKVGEAARLLQEAVDLVKDDKTLDPVARAMLLVNLGVTQLAAENRAKGLELLEEGMKLVEELKTRESRPVVDAVLYNRALARVGSKKSDDRKKAIELFEEYLTKSDPRSAWWPIAYSKYKALCTQEKQTARKEADLRDPRRAVTRMQTTLTLADGKTVSVSEPMKDVIARIGKPRSAGVASPFTQHLFDKQGFEVLGTDRVVAIVLRSAKSPPVTLKPLGAASKGGVELKVGMTWKQVEATLPNPTDYVFRELTQKDKYYYYYRNLGIAVFFDGPLPGGKISELVLVQIPN